MTVYLDVNCLIYFVERNPVWWPKVTARIAALRAGGNKLAVSDLTRAECLVGPFKSGDTAVLASYQAVFSDPEIHVLPLTSAVCEQAARFRATYGLRMPDAMHLSAAVEHGCGLFLTNDAKLSRCVEIPVEMLS